MKVTKKLNGYLFAVLVSFLVLIFVKMPVEAAEWTSPDGTYTLEYDFVEDSGESELVITGYTGAPVNLEFPAVIDGKPVVAVGKDAFEDCDTLKRVVFPEGMRLIGYAAFYNTSLTEIEWSSTVETLEYGAFALSAIKSLYIPPTLKEIRFGAFSDTPLEELVFDIDADYSGMREIRGEAFSYTNLTKLVLPNAPFLDHSGLVMAKVRGGMLWGILITAVIGLFIKDPATGAAITALPSKVVSLPDSLSPIFCKFEWSQVLSWDMLVVVFTFLFIDMFDTMGTIIGVHQGAGLINKGGDEIPGVEKMFLADSIATVAGACFGTSTTTTYVESASGVGEGGRTGLTAFSVVICFALALFLSPIFLAIPGAATAPALIIVGVMMMPSIKNIHWEDYSKAIPAFVTIIMMPLAYSISDGILLGVISYVICHAVSGQFKKISITMWVLAALFICKYIFI